MKSKFNKNSKMSNDELAKTQVLNLSDVERIASYEKSISKKPAIIIGIIGLVALSIGLFYPKISTFLEKNSNENIISNRIDDYSNDISNDTNDYNLTNNQLNNQNTTIQLTCTKTQLANPDGTDIYLTYNFTFVNNYLQSYTKLGIFNKNVSNQLADITIENLYNGYLNLSQALITGYYLQTSKTTSGLTVNVNIDLTKLDQLSFPDSHKGNNISNVEFALNETKDNVYNIITQNGFACQ